MDRRGPCAAVDDAAHDAPHGTGRFAAEAQEFAEKIQEEEIGNAPRRCGRDGPAGAPALVVWCDLWLDDGRELRFAREAELLADAFVDRLPNVAILTQELLRVLAPLAEPLAAVREPRAALLDDALLDGEIEQVSFLGNPLAVHHVELGLTERRRHLVLHDLDARAAADHLVAVLDAGDAPDVDAHRRVELQRAAARGRFGIAEHDADLFTQLVDEDERRFRLRDRAGELPQRLGHQARLQAHLRVAHLAFDLGLR